MSYEITLRNASEQFTVGMSLNANATMQDVTEIIVAVWPGCKIVIVE